MDLSIVIPTYNEGENIKELLQSIRQVVSGLTNDYEIIVVDGGSMDGTYKYARQLGAVFYKQILPGYGGALREGFRLAKGDYILTMDADLSHQPSYIRDLWDNRNKAELVIASRYVDSGRADMPLGRKVLSIILNKIYGYILSLPYKDLSSGFRLYNKDVLSEIELTELGFSMLQEALTKIHCNGYRILEVPFCYKPRRYGRSHVRLLKMAFSYLCTLFRMWRLRNSIESADYDERAFNSRILPQRLWQRRRYKIIMGMLDSRDRILDIGCGTSRIIKGLPNAVGLDINHKVLRYLGNKRNLLVEASIKDLPFKNGVFNIVICSEVIEHIHREDFKINEIRRVLVQDGVFILGTPDYGRIWWRIVEWIYKKIIPTGYGKQHITHYTSEQLINMFNNKGWEILDRRYVFGGEVVFKVRKQSY